MQAGRLSSRQEEVLALAASGQSRKQMANTLGISENTVHVAAVFAKLGVHNMPEAVAVWVRERERRRVSPKWRVVMPAA